MGRPPRTSASSGLPERQTLVLKWKLPGGTTARWELSGRGDGASPCVLTGLAEPENLLTETPPFFQSNRVVSIRDFLRSHKHRS